MQFFVTPSCVITTFAVDDPSNVTTSRRDEVDGASPSLVTVACMARMMVPAVGKVGRPSWTGITRPVVVSPAMRVAVNATPSLVPVVVSVPAALASTVRWVLPDASPLTVRSLELLTVLVAVSWCRLVPLTVRCTFTVFVVPLTNCCWTLPAASRKEKDRVRVRPPCVSGPQSSRFVVVEKAQASSSSKSPNGP